MVFQDGGGYITRDGNNPTLNVIDNLIAQKKIPVMICVFINPGDISGSAGTPTYNQAKAYSDKWQRTVKDSMRSILYDTVSDRYDRFLTTKFWRRFRPSTTFARIATAAGLLGFVRRDLFF